ncbi:MAG: bifunctional UDP-N-acetylglucosamine diphosphorylase/glucosamine-1-phosphate N-acetyltransferase GlmU [Candidatus Velthaea sp.]
MAAPARAIVLAAGMGTRMKSTQPKVLHEICGRPMLWYTLSALAAAGVQETVVVTNAVVEPRIGPLLATFGARSVVQQPQRGTGHAVQIGLRALSPESGTVVVAYGDMPLVSAQIFADVIGAVRADDAAGLGLTTALMPLPSSFGRVIRHGDSVAKIVEERDCSPAERAVNEMNAGIYAYDERALRSVIDDLRDDNVQRELYLTDTVALLLAAGLQVVPVACADYRLVLGVNDRVELAQARALLNRSLCEQHMRSGVTIVDPATTYLEPGLVIGADSIVYPNTAIGGATVIGANAVLGPNSRIANATIGDGVQITESVVLDTQLAAHVRVGPFAHLRQGNVVGADARVGNFVELKNTTLHAAAKANHLAYLGDAEVGAGANIGAGTITCNYDGKHKHRTEIGPGAFVGSNSSLVAPVRIGAGAQTGAGAVVIRDVGDGERVVGNPARPLVKKSSV